MKENKNNAVSGQPAGQKKTDYRTGNAHDSLLEVTQKEIRPLNGFVMLFLITALIIASAVVIVIGGLRISSGAPAGTALLVAGIIGCCIFPVLYAGLKVVGPNEALVLTLFGNYYGTILRQGFHYVNPFVTFNNPAYSKALEKAKAESSGSDIKKLSSGSISISQKKTVSMKNMTLNNGTQKVNDVMGNPVIIGAVVIWKVVNPTKAVFHVEDYEEFLSIQTDSTIRNIARLYPYDSMDTDDNGDTAERTLRGSAQEIADSMKAELAERVEFAGLEIEEVKITHLSYAEEIAAAMLQRQQAEAVIAARTKIVDGAVSMVKMAIDKLGDEDIVILDEERKAAMVSNLLVVLCSGRESQPVINSGSIY